MLITQQNLARKYLKASKTKLAKNTISSSPEIVLESELPFITKSTTLETYFDENIFDIPAPSRQPTLYL